MEIEPKTLTTCEVAPDGDAVILGFTDTSGAPAQIRLSLNQVGALAMTPPDLITKALRSRYGDHSLRYAYPSRCSRSCNMSLVKRWHPALLRRFKYLQTSLLTCAPR
jgi:hypothetical protein